MKHIILALFMVMLSAPALADSRDAEVKKAEEYLRNLDTAKAHFIQKSSEGSRRTGTFYLDRPGKLRFEYDERGDFIVADGFLIYFYDGELQEQTHAPIGQTLADFLLRSDLRLHNDITVEDITEQGGFTLIKMTQTEDPGAGNLQLVFSTQPYELRKWRVTDAAGIVTDIELQNMEKGLDLPGDLFSYHDPRGKKTTND